MLCPFVEIEYFKPSEKPFSDGLFAYMAAAPTAAAPTPIEVKKACTEAAYGAVPAPAVKNVTATPMAITRTTTAPIAMTCIQSIFEGKFIAPCAQHDFDRAVFARGILLVRQPGLTQGFLVGSRRQFLFAHPADGVPAEVVATVAIADSGFIVVGQIVGGVSRDG